MNLFPLRRCMTISRMRTDILCNASLNEHASEITSTY